MPDLHTQILAWCATQDAQHATSTHRSCVHTAVAAVRAAALASCTVMDDADADRVRRAIAKALRIDTGSASA